MNCKNLQVFSHVTLYRKDEDNESVVNGRVVFVDNDE